MSKPNILITMADQLNGTLFPDGPVDWLHAPNLKSLRRNRPASKASDRYICNHMNINILD
ncbi:MAG TPA: hypothetical protein DIT67_04690 [Octadecabacter sp.]|nr:hypothetical protein [Octadecabacter sp.]